MVLLIFTLTWILLSLLNGYIGSRKKIGFYDPFFVSILLSPIMGAFIIWQDR